MQLARKLNPDAKTNFGLSGIRNSSSKKAVGPPGPGKGGASAPGHADAPTLIVLVPAAVEPARMTQQPHAPMRSALKQARREAVEEGVVEREGEDGHKHHKHHKQHRQGKRLRMALPEDGVEATEGVKEAKHPQHQHQHQGAMGPPVSTGPAPPVISVAPVAAAGPAPTGMSPWRFEGAARTPPACMRFKGCRAHATCSHVFVCHYVPCVCPPRTCA
jgi:hypothetical protein